MTNPDQTGSSGEVAGNVSPFDELPRDPREFLTPEERHTLAEALESISRIRREAQATSGDLQLY